jgi:membrane protease YdiL (CAAX protease family)
VAVVLAAIRLSGEPWSRFGITRPDPIDLFTAFLVCFVKLPVTLLGGSILADILRSMVGNSYVDRLQHYHPAPIYAHGWSGFLCLVALAASVGLAEELVMRAYLITRFERLLRSTWVAVVLSAIIFGMFHSYQGLFGVWHAFLSGVVYGVAFAWSRRLWPIAIAHAVFDLSSFLYSAQ